MKSFCMNFNRNFRVMRSEFSYIHIPVERIRHYFYIFKRMFHPLVPDDRYKSTLLIIGNWMIASEMFDDNL